MATEDAVLEAAGEKKRVREEGGDFVEGVANGEAAENVNGAEEDVDKVDVKRAKKQDADPAASPVDVQVKKIVDSTSVETVIVKDGK